LFNQEKNWSSPMSSHVMYIHENVTAKSIILYN
jgi:hypothetical protein